MKSIFRRKTRQSESEEISSSNNQIGEIQMPDDSMVIEIRQPKELGLSKKVWLCKSVCNTVLTYYGNEKIDDEDFGGRFLADDVINVLKSSKLLSPEHWENEYVLDTSDGAKCKYVSIQFYYKDGTKFIRTNEGVLGSTRLLRAAEAILNCESLCRIIYGKDDELLQKAMTSHFEKTDRPVKTAPIPDKDEGKTLSSFMIGMYKGMMTEIQIQEWRALNDAERRLFSPRFVYFRFDGYGNVKGQTIGVSVNEQIVDEASEVKKSFTNYIQSFNPSGISGNEQGDCHLPNQEETRLLEYYHDRINLTLKEWGLQSFSEYFWTDSNGEIIPNSNDPIMMKDLTIGLRFIVEYWSTRIIFKCNA